MNTEAIDENVAADWREDESVPPIVSVAMPAYNAERYIGRAVESILNQTLTDLELIIFLDAPTDRTNEIVRRYAARDTRVRIIESDENVGMSVGLNRAIATARAPFVGRMDADDISVPDRFERQLAVMRENPEVAIVGSDALHINSNDEVLGLSIAGPRTIEEFRQRHAAGELTVVLDGTSFMRRDAFEAVGGYNPEMPIAVEVEFQSRIAEHGAIVAIDEPLLLYRLHPGSRVATRFFEGRGMHRYVQARQRAILLGETPLEYREYLASEQAAPAWQRIRIRLSDLGQFYYRTAGVRLAEGRKGAAVFNLARALVMSPGFVLGRAWHRRFSPRARRQMQAAKPPRG